jgi:hypothetical protein
VRSELVNVPGKEGKVRVDRYRYPKGHPKAGRFAPKSEAKRSGTVREVARRNGKWERLEKSKSRAKVKEANAQTGRAFTGDVRAYSLPAAVDEAQQLGKTVFLKLGGVTYKIPEQRLKDLKAFLADMKPRHMATERKVFDNDSPQGPLMKLSTGTNGILIDMDALSFASPEVTQELGTLQENDPEEAQELADYTAETAEQYLGISVDPSDVVDNWEDMEAENWDE